MESVPQSTDIREPRPACRASVIRHRSKDRMAITRASFVELCRGNVVAAQLLNETLFVTESRITAGESAWFQRKSAYWVGALQGAASERTIRDAFKVVKTLGLMDFRQANGDQRGASYRLNVERLQSEIDKLDADTPSAKETSAKTTGVQSTPAESTDHPGNDTAHPGRTADHPGKNDRGSHLSYTLAGEPLLEPSLEPQQTAEQNAAADMASLVAALNTHGFACRAGAGHKFEQKALELANGDGGGISLRQQTRMLMSADFDVGDMKTPIGVLMRVGDLLRRKAAQRKHEPKPETSYDWRNATIGPKPPGHRCDKYDACAEKRAYKVKTPDGQPVALCAYCHRLDAPRAVNEAYVSLVNAETAAFNEELKPELAASVESMPAVAA